MNGLHVVAPFALFVAVSPMVFDPSTAGVLAHRFSAGQKTLERVQDRACEPAGFPKTLPSADAVVNTATLTRAVAADSTLRLSADVTFSVRFLRNGQPEWVKAIGTDVRAEQARLQAIVAAHTRSQAAAKQPWNVRLQLLAGDSVRYAVARSQECPVERVVTANPGAVGTGLAMASMEDIRALRSSGEARAVVEIGTNGEILDVELVRSSGSRIQDELVLQLARESRYHPAIVDGIPVVGRFEHSTRVRTRTSTVRTRVN